MLEKIVSGGQTGVDQGALDAAIEAGFPCGGWCPKGRITENGRLPGQYPLKEWTTAGYPARTEANVRDSDGTLILTDGALKGGTALTGKVAIKMGRPCVLVDLKGGSIEMHLKTVQEFITSNSIRVLNVAGPRESKSPGIQGETKTLISALIEQSA